MSNFSPKEITCKNSEAVTLRKAIAEDAKKLNGLAIEVFNTSEYLITTSEDFVSFDEHRQKERILSFQNKEGRLLLVAEYQDDLIGILDFQNGQRKRIAHRGSIGMSIKSNWRSHGIGQLMLESLIEWVKEQNFLEFIHLTVMEENKPAMSLYSKLGFQEIGRDLFGVKISEGEYLTEIYMSLKV